VQVDFLAMLGIVLGALLLLAFGTVIPGLAAIRILDPTADRFRELFLCFNSAPQGRTRKPPLEFMGET